MLILKIMSFARGSIEAPAPIQQRLHPLDERILGRVGPDHSVPPLREVTHTKLSSVPQNLFFRTSQFFHIPKPALPREYSSLHDQISAFSDSIE